MPFLVGTVNTMTTNTVLKKDFFYVCMGIAIVFTMSLFYQGQVNGVVIYWFLDFKD